MKRKQWKSVIFSHHHKEELTGRHVQKGHCLLACYWPCFPYSLASLLTAQINHSPLCQLWHFSLFAMSQFNMLTQQLASQSCGLLLLSALREIHGSSQTGLTITRAGPRQEVGMCGHERGGLWEGEVGSPSSNIAQFFNLSTKLYA